jgi:amino acid adenylation domain-containing protein/non-ribosomal peptide synthase protein (TIGR01720 family)
MYKTGDLVRYNSDGTITYLGRKDSQVKLNGQRIEVGEIEHHIMHEIPPEAQSAVELVKISNKEKTTKALAAFLCLQPFVTEHLSNLEDFLLPMTDSIRNTATDLEVTLTARLPAYMVPAIYIPLAKMPLTSSGKLDRRKLRTISESLSEEQASMYRLARKVGRAPSTEMETTLATLWEAILKLEHHSVGVEDNFFRLGGDSIEAMRLITAARSQGISLTVANVFQKPILSEMSDEAHFIFVQGHDDVGQLDIEPFSLLRNVESIDALKEEIATQCRIPIDSIEDAYPVTSIQAGLVALSNKDPGAYVAQNVYRLPSDIDVTRFREAWQRVIEVEVILRTRIVYTKGLGFVQVVVREPITWHTTTNLQDIVNGDRLLPAHNGGILSRYTIVSDTSNTSFVWTAHHAIYDGWCIPLMLEKVEACYRDLNAARLNTAVSYATFIKYLSEIDAAESDNFWKTKLSETTAYQFPQLPHPSYQVHATGLASHVANVSREVGSNITLPSTIRAAWALVVGIYSGGSEDVVFGETLTGRDCPIQGISDMIGPTLATVPTRIRVDPNMSISRFLEEVQSLSAEAQQFQYAGLQHIKHISEDTAVACGFQNLLAIHHDNNEVSGGFWDLQSSGTVGTNFYSYPLTMSCQIGDGKVDLEAHYDQTVISIWQVEAILRQFEFVLESLISPENMDQTLGEMELLNLNDYTAIKVWNSEPGKKVNKCVHQLIEQQVLEQPDFTVAVDSWDAKFTYRELDELSTRLALQLVKQKVQSTLIPLCFEKSAWTVVAMLAILKSGAAFVPLDPTAPVTRLREIIADINADKILCSSKYQALCSAMVPETFIVDRNTIDQLPPSRLFRHRWDALPSCDPNAPAYVIFTSGTTGRPKGTVIQHYAFCSGAAAHAPALRMHPSSRVLQFASYTFDASLLEILTTLTIGACVCVPSDDERLNDVTKAINELSVTWTLLTPSFIQVIQPSQVPTLRTLVLGGEAMSQTHISTWADKVELINAYGPSECAVVATVNPYISYSTDPSNMGRATGGRAWITDKHNHNRLVPIGSMGELIIEGPLLAQGYLKNDAKTAEVFIENPTWAITDTHATNPRIRRMYKTGDLVKYTADGRLLFCGRKDTQVKVHGQRLELGEVEHYLRLDPSIQHALATIPNAGFCKKRLVAVLSLQELATSNISQGALKVVEPEACSFYLTGIRERLCEHLPAYMIPSNWVVLRKLPLLPSGKLDRRRLGKWVEDMTSEVYHQISDIDKEATNTRASEIEGQLQKVWGKALNLPADQIGLHQSFLHLGGDSISAMQVMSSCRAQDLGVTVQDIIQSKSIAQLAQCVTLPEKLSYDEEEADLPFDLSPMQKLYFECVGDKWAHFNQSVVLGLNRRVDALDVSRAIETIVKSHSMLRARFAKNEVGVWQQQIAPEMSLSYRLDFGTTTLDLVPKIIEESQKGLNVEKGPVFAVDLLDIGDNQQMISLVAHHLVIDVVSWRIILQDLEDILESGSLKIQRSLPFQTWSRLQAEQTQRAMSKNVFLPEDVPVADFNYWGMADHQNVYGDTVEDGFKLDPETSLLLLGNCLDSMKTEPIDIFLATVMASFRKVFPDRGTVPAIFNEGHGREPWPGSKLDLSRTVGWFTTMCPVYLPNDLGEGDNDIVSMVRWVKDLRNRIPEKGRPYFAYRLLTEEGRERFPGHWPMEVTFNYLGKLQQLERNDGLLQPLDGLTSAGFDINPEVPRFALFEVSAEVTHGSIKMSFSYNRKMKRQAKIRRWVLECQRFLQDAAQQLAQLKSERTLSDFPLLPLSYTGLAKITENLPQLGVTSLDDLEDIYPCTPMQQGMLLAQLKQPDLYAYSAVFEARPTKANHVTDATLLTGSWQDVVNRHAALRTVFIESLAESGRMDQVVLKHCVARTAWLHSDSEDVSFTFAEQTPLSFRDKQPPHRFSICKLQDGRVFFRLEISHVISDGTSMPIILRDLSDAYQSKLSRDRTGSLNPDMTMGREIVEARRNTAIIPSVGPLYSDYIAYLRSKSPDEDINYWKSYLADVEPCNFPPLTDGRKDQKALRSLVLNLSQATQLRTFCTKNGLTLSNALQLVWALVLRSYTGSTDVCFGYLTSGRDAPIPGLQSLAVGAFINMLTFRIDLIEELPLSQALEKLQTDFVQSMAHQSCSLAEVQHELQLSGTSLFNTAFTFQKRSNSTDAKHSVITFDVVDAQDPSEYDVTVNVEAFDEGIEVHFGYWTNILSESQAMNMAKTFDHVLNSIITCPKPDRTVGEIEFFSEHSRQQVMRWNQLFPSAVDRCIHDIIDERKLGRPASTPAICAWNGDFTYAELELVTNKLAARLVHLGVGPEVYVPLCFEKSVWTVVSMIAVMKAGGAFVPLDPSHPQGRLKHFIDDVKANMVLCSGIHKEKISGAAGQTLVIDQSTIEGLKGEVLPRSRAKPSDPAYVRLLAFFQGQVADIL